MTTKRLLNSPYFAACLNKPGEVSPWSDQKQSSKGKTNSVYRKNWNAFLESQKPKLQELPGPRILRRVTKDGRIIPIGPEPMDPEHKEHLTSILKTE
jgi:hypothetical protein